MSLGDKLSIDALFSNIDKNQLSPLGSAMFSASKNAISKFSEGKSLKTITEFEASDILSFATDSVPDILTGALSLVHSVSSISSAIPVISTLLAFAGGIISSAEMQSTQTKQKNIEHCNDIYSPPGLPTGWQGNRAPADLFGFNESGSTPTVALFLKQLYSNDSLASPTSVKELKNIRRPLEKSGLIPAIKWPKGIDSKTRDALLKMHNAMKQSREGSVDGGSNVFPVYMDLLTSQFRSGNITWDYAWLIYQSEITASFSRPEVDCSDYERRGFDEASFLVRSWKLTIEPSYGADKAKLDKLIKEASNYSIPQKLKANFSLKALKTMAGKSKLTAAPIKRVLSAAKNLSSKGVTFNAAPIDIGPALVKRPVAPHVYTDIEQQIIDASHGIYGSNQAAQQSIAETVADTLPEDVEGLKEARALILQAEMGDECAQDTIEAIADEAESGNEEAIDTLGYIVAVIDGIEAGTIPPLTDDDIEDFSFCDEVSGVGDPNAGGVIIWKNGQPTSMVPSGIRNQMTAKGIIIHAKGTAQGFDPQPDPPKVGYGYGDDQYFTGLNDNNLPVFGTTYGVMKG